MVLCPAELLPAVEFVEGTTLFACWGLVLARLGAPLKMDFSANGPQVARFRWPAAPCELACASSQRIRRVFGPTTRLAALQRGWMAGYGSARPRARTRQVLPRLDYLGNHPKRQGHSLASLPSWVVSMIAVVGDLPAEILPGESLHGSIPK